MRHFSKGSDMILLSSSSPSTTTNDFLFSSESNASSRVSAGFSEEASCVTIEITSSTENPSIIHDRFSNASLGKASSTAKKSSLDAMFLTKASIAFGTAS